MATLIQRLTTLDAVDPVHTAFGPPVRLVPRRQDFKPEELLAEPPKNNWDNSTFRDRMCETFQQDKAGAYAGQNRRVAAMITERAKLRSMPKEFTTHQLLGLGSAARGFFSVQIPPGFKDFFRKHPGVKLHMLEECWKTAQQADVNPTMLLNMTLNKMSSDLRMSCYTDKPEILEQAQDSPEQDWTSWISVPAGPGKQAP